MTNVTELELKLLATIATDEYTPLNGEIPTEVGDTDTYIDVPNWALYMSLEVNQVKGILSSLVKKELVEITEHGIYRVDDPDSLPTIIHTDAGFKIYRASL
ncbi:MAG: hypothetical protein KAR06_00435 [Deltaproteobacteria bacterium]|nr:hypothetical protein [Deltaproteobacteria bacterium]